MKKLEIAKSLTSAYGMPMLKKAPLEGIIDLLPRQTYNCEPFGLMLMETYDGTKKRAWTCCYYTHYSKKSDDRIPIIKGPTIKSAAIKMLKWFVKNMPESIK